jgi:enamine deaminase RidA (YjgF/YER057c/UK114 family)
MESKSVRVIQRKEFQEIHIQIVPLKGETPSVFTGKISEILNKYDAKIIRASFFGELDKKEITLKNLEEKLEGMNFPVTWIEGQPCIDTFIGGAYLIAVSGINIIRLSHENQIAGSFFQTREADFCYIGGLYSDPRLSAAEQTLGVLNSAESILEQVHLKYENTIRTWFYLDKILDWYKDFNLNRTSFYQKRNIFNTLVPASTGINGKNPYGSKIGFELTAIKPKSGSFSISKVRSPLQGSAEAYGSSFSRAVKYSDGEYTNMTVSGTASIDPEGNSVHFNNIEKQIELSFEVVKAILKSQNFDFSDMVRSYAYCCDKGFIKAFNEYIETNLPFSFPFICAENKICRENLLFEIELDVIKKDPR